MKPEDIEGDDLDPASAWQTLRSDASSIKELVDACETLFQIPEEIEPLIGFLAGRLEVISHSDTQDVKRLPLWVEAVEQLPITESVMRTRIATQLLRHALFLRNFNGFHADATFCSALAKYTSPVGRDCLDQLADFLRPTDRRLVQQATLQRICAILEVYPKERARSCAALSNLVLRILRHRFDPLDPQIVAAMVIYVNAFCAAVAMGCATPNHVTRLLRLERTDIISLVINKLKRLETAWSARLQPRDSALADIRKVMLKLSTHQQRRARRR